MQLNGSTATIVSWKSSNGRYSCVIDGQSHQMAFKPKNVLLPRGADVKVMTGAALGCIGSVRMVGQRFEPASSDGDHVTSVSRTRHYELAIDESRSMRDAVAALREAPLYDENILEGDEGQLGLLAQLEDMRALACAQFQ